MLNFRNVNIVFAIAAAAMGVVYYFEPFNWFYFYLVLLIYMSILFYGSFYVGSEFYMKMICSAKTDKKLIAISFDDGPVSTITPKILDLLAEYNVKATFFCIGNKIEKNVEIVSRMEADGHIVGNHSWSHTAMIDLYPAAKVIEEITKTTDAVYSVIGQKPRFFRPPIGITNPSIATAVKKTGTTGVGWNIRSLDTNLNSSPDAIANRVIRKLRPGSIVLFHDVNPEIITILRKCFAEMSRQGYKIVRLDQLINEKAYA